MKIFNIFLAEGDSNNLPYLKYGTHILEALMGKFGYVQEHKFYGSELTPSKHPIIPFVIPRVEVIDPNWVSVLALTSGGKLEVVLNGPKHGDFNLTNELENLLPPEVMQRCLKRKDKDLFNTNHTVEIIPGRTELEFENGDSGYVESVDGDRFTVVRFGCSPCCKEEYTRQRLLEELALAPYQHGGEPHTVNYFPFRHHLLKDKPFLQNADDLHNIMCTTGGGGTTCPLQSEES